MKSTDNNGKNASIKKYIIRIFVLFLVFVVIYFSTFAILVYNGKEAVKDGHLDVQYRYLPGHDFHGWAEQLLSLIFRPAYYVSRLIGIRIGYPQF